MANEASLTGLDAMDVGTSFNTPGIRSIRFQGFDHAMFYADSTFAPPEPDDNHSGFPGPYIRGELKQRQKESNRVSCEECEGCAALCEVNRTHLWIVVDLIKNNYIGVLCYGCAEEKEDELDRRDALNAQPNAQPPLMPSSPPPQPHMDDL